MSTRFYDTDLSDAAWAFVAPVLCGTVYHYFQAWRNSGAWVHLHRVLYEQARRHAGRAACPSVVIMDGQSVKTTERGGARGFRRA
jgi:transposase